MDLHRHQGYSLSENELMEAIMDPVRPRPDLAVMQRIEELLREQLREMDEDIAQVEPHEISRHMQCGVHSSGALSYSWKGVPILDVTPELQPDGTIKWRFFTRDTPLQ